MNTKATRLFKYTINTLLEYYVISSERIATPNRRYYIV